MQIDCVREYNEGMGRILEGGVCRSKSRRRHAALTTRSARLDRSLAFPA